MPRSSAQLRHGLGGVDRLLLAALHVANLSSFVALEVSVRPPMPIGLLELALEAATGEVGLGGGSQAGSPAKP